MILRMEKQLTKLRHSASAHCSTDYAKYIGISIHTYNIHIINYVLRKLIANSNAITDKQSRQAAVQCTTSDHSSVFKHEMFNNVT